ncbi:hypothetical protein A4R35_10240 [Thermogemmatispora tikiterensis]|uniref:Uncharacterized protein n=1 Tax=Thermogemmatispora tikiterensis TaxID=1825093 RepID=A0A328VP28_9CHLR|nr:hypothetical protein A4R35_10240 [Thermogemmatispora tikiterensis]
MATFPQPLIHLAMRLPPCPHCSRRQAQPEVASLPTQASATSLVPGRRGGASAELSSPPDEKTSIALRREY